MRLRARLLLSGGLAIGAAACVAACSARGHAPARWDVVDHVVDGDTIVLRRGATVRLVQIDTPEVYPRRECFGEQASAETRALLPRRARVRLFREPATSAVDRYGRLLRYVIRRDGVNVNRRLVADGAAAPYFFHGARGRYAGVLMRDARAARASGRGLWGYCARTRLDPVRGVSTGGGG